MEKVIITILGIIVGMLLVVLGQHGGAIKQLQMQQELNTITQFE